MKIGPFRLRFPLLRRRRAGGDLPARGRRGDAGEVGEEEPFPAPVRIPIEDHLDLHAFRPSEITDVVDAYLEAALEAGFREVRLIHGRGKGVQRARVQRFLARDRRVERFSDAPPGRGGWGATLVWLHTPASTGR